MGIEILHHAYLNIYFTSLSLHKQNILKVIWYLKLNIWASETLLKYNLAIFQLVNHLRE